MRLALFQPDIPQNVGAMVRLAACLGAPMEIIEPCAFPLSERSLRRTALDYGPLALVRRHASWTDFLSDPARTDGRLLLFTTRGAQNFTDFAFQPGDTLLMGQESAGAPEHVHAAAQGRLIVPIAPGARSLNLVTAAAIGLAEGLRQTGGFPHAPQTG